MAELTAIRNHIIFQFVDGKTKHMGVTQFQEKTEWGLEYVRVDDSTKLPRWGRIICVGPEVSEDLQPGMAVLIEPLAWTNEFDFEGEDYWRTDSDRILGIEEGAIPAS